MSKKIYTDAELASCAGRELGLRRGVYPKFVASGKLTQEAADEELAKMSAVAQRLTALSKSSLTFAGIWHELGEVRRNWPNYRFGPVGLMEHVVTVLSSAENKHEEPLRAGCLALAAQFIRLAEELPAQWKASAASATSPEQPPVPAEKPSVSLTPYQCLQVVLNHPRITGREKTQCLLRLQDATDEQITEYVAAWQHTITEREQLQVEVATPKQEEDLPWLH